MTPYYITLKFHQNISAVIQPPSGNYNARDYTWYKEHRVESFASKNVLVTPPLQNWMLIMN